MNLLIKESNKLSQIFPIIKQELCNKISNRVESLTTTFMNIYDSMHPQKVIFVNGVAKLLDISDEINISFATQSGITLLYSKTYLNEDIYINGNQIDQQLFFDNKDKHLQGIHQKADEIQKMLQIIRKKSEQNKQFYGGIIYIYSNIREQLLHSAECFMLAIALAFLNIRQQLTKYSIQSFFNLLMQSDPSLNKKVLKNILLKYRHSQIFYSINDENKQNNNNQDQLIAIYDPISNKSIITQDSNGSIVNSNNNQSKSTKSIASLQENRNKNQIIESYLNYNNKSFILCHLDLSSQQIQYFLKNKNKIQQINKKLSDNQIKRQFILQNQAQDINIKFSNQELFLIKYIQDNNQILKNLHLKNISLDQFIKQKHNIDKQYEIHEDIVLQLVEQIVQSIVTKQSYCLIEGRTLLISVNINKHAQIIKYLKKLLNNNQLSTQKYLNQPHDNKKNQRQAQDIMFKTIPSIGCGVYVTSIQSQF